MDGLDLGKSSHFYTAEGFSSYCYCFWVLWTHGVVDTKESESN